MRSKTIDKFVVASYIIYIIKQNNLIKSNGKEASHLGKRKKKDTKKELLEQKRIKFQIYESFTAIIATIVTIITAVLSWID